MSAKPQANFRLSPELVGLLKRVGKKKNQSSTEIVEYCVARYALDLGVDVEEATVLLLEYIARAVAAHRQPGTPPLSESPDAPGNVNLAAAHAVAERRRKRAIRNSDADRPRTPGGG